MNLFSVEIKYIHYIASIFNKGLILYDKIILWNQLCYSFEIYFPYVLSKNHDIWYSCIIIKINQSLIKYNVDYKKHAELLKTWVVS